MFKVLEGTVPSSVESRLVSFLGCLSAQQSFILRIMSVIGTRGIEAELLEVRKAEAEIILYLTCLSVMIPLRLQPQVWASWQVKYDVRPHSPTPVNLLP